MENSREVATNTVSAFCCNHKLNISFSESSEVRSMRNAVGTMKVVISFFNAPSKRNFAFLAIVGKKLTGLCESQWEEMHDGVTQLRDLLPEIIATLNHVSTWQDLKTASEAKTLTAVSCYSKFLAALVFMSDLLSVTESLS